VASAKTRRSTVTVHVWERNGWWKTMATVYPGRVTLCEGRTREEAMAHMTNYVQPDAMAVVEVP